MELLDSIIEYIPDFLPDFDTGIWYLSELILAYCVIIVVPSTLLRIIFPNTDKNAFISVIYYILLGGISIWMYLEFYYWAIPALKAFSALTETTKIILLFIAPIIIAAILSIFWYAIAFFIFPLLPIIDAVNWIFEQCRNRKIIIELAKYKIKNIKQKLKIKGQKYIEKCRERIKKWIKKCKNYIEKFVSYINNQNTD